MAFVYILQSEKGLYYIGSTTELDRRIKQHTVGHTPSTHRMGEMCLVFNQPYETLEKARKVELWLKKMKRKDYIKKIIKEGKIKKFF